MTPVGARQKSCVFYEKSACFCNQQYTGKETCQALSNDESCLKLMRVECKRCNWVQTKTATDRNCDPWPFWRHATLTPDASQAWGWGQITGLICVRRSVSAACNFVRRVKTETPGNAIALPGVESVWKIQASEFAERFAGSPVVGAGRSLLIVEESDMPCSDPRLPSATGHALELRF